VVFRFLTCIYLWANPAVTRPPSREPRWHNHHCEHFRAFFTTEQAWPVRWCKHIQQTRNTFCRTRSLSNATFSFGTIFTLSIQCHTEAVWKSDDFSLRYGDISIFKMADLELFYHHTRPPTKSLLLPQPPVKFHVNLIHRSEDIAIWIFSHIWLEMPIQPQK